MYFSTRSEIDFCHFIAVQQEITLWNSMPWNYYAIMSNNQPAVSSGSPWEWREGTRVPPYNTQLQDIDRSISRYRT